MLLFAVAGSVPSTTAGGKYLYPGTANPSTNEVTFKSRNSFTLTGIKLRARVALLDVSLTVTVRKNGVDAMSATILVGNTSGSEAGAAADVPFTGASGTGGDDLSVKYVLLGDNKTSDLVVQLVYS